MRALVRFHARDLVAEEAYCSGVAPQIARDQVEERRLARAVGTDDEAPLARHDAERDVVGGRQAAERFFQTDELERGRHRDLHRAHRRRTPGTTPSGMKMTMKTKTKPSSMFQRSM